MQYDHHQYIASLICGRESKPFPPELVAKIREMFAQIQQPYEETKPPDRSNFMNYKHCVHKMLELLGEDQYLKHFPLLKASTKRYEQDQMWKAICGKMRWQFIESSC